MAGRNSALALSGLDVVDRVLDRRDLLGFFVGNFRFEFLFQSHHELNGVQRVGAKIVDERCVVLDFLGLETELFGNDPSDLIFDAAHNSYPLLIDRPDHGARPMWRVLYWNRW